MKTTEKIQKRAEVRNFLEECYGLKTLKNVGNLFFVEGCSGFVLEDIVTIIKRDLNLEAAILFIWKDERCGISGITFCGTEEQSEALHEAFGGGFLWGHKGWTLQTTEEIPIDDVIEVLF